MGRVVDGLAGRPAPADKPAATESLSAAIDKGIALLEAKKSTEFLERFMLPDVLSQIKKSGEWDEITSKFKLGRDASLLKTLKAAKEMKPVLSDDGTVATFDVKKLPGEHPPKIQFRKVKGLWYIADK